MPLARQNGPAIRALRVKSGHKPGELANRASISYSTLDNIENERKNASIEVIHRLAKALEVAPSAIVRDPASLVGKDAIESVSA